MLDHLLNHPLVKRGLDFILRPRHVGVALVKCGVAILVAALAGGWAFEFAFSDPESGTRLNIKSAEGAPAVAFWAVLAAGLLLTVIGAVLAIHGWFVDRRKEARRLNVIVELRGLHSGPSTPVVPAAIGLGQGTVRQVLIDFRPQAEGKLVDPDVALQKLDALKPAISAALSGKDEADLAVAIGGLAATPTLFLAGMLMDDEANVVLYDWDRDRRTWRALDGMDDGARVRPVDFSALAAGTKRAVLALSLSYAVDEAALRRRFGDGASFVHLRLEQTLANGIWSPTKQEAIAKTFRETAQKLQETGIETLDLVVAAPSSLSIRLGMSYDRRLLPDVWVHQYEKTSAEGYPWSLHMPTHGVARGVVERHALPVVEEKLIG